MKILDSVCTREQTNTKQCRCVLLTVAFSSLEEFMIHGPKNIDHIEKYDPQIVSY